MSIENSASHVRRPPRSDSLLRRAARFMAGVSRTVSAGRDVAVFDDIFPQPLSAFRLEEFVSYLDLLPELKVYSDGRALRFVGETRSIEELIADHTKRYPRHAGRISPLSNGALSDGAVAYTIFADNAYFYLSQIEQRRMPFAFTLYAGGGFGLERPDSDERLARVFGSPWFRCVIATETITRDYLLTKKLCPADKINFILGGVIARYAFDPPVAKARFGSAKKNIDICFVAGRYAPTGADKGYDLFVDVANRLCAAGADARFHVVGNFDPTIIDLGSAASRFTFYGLRLQDFFIEFYRHMDLMLAPTRPFVRKAGAFDSFPTAACVEAGLQEVAIACTDQLGLNQILEDGREVVIVRPDAADIVDRLMQLIGDPERLAAIGEDGRKRMAEIFNSEVQIKPRVEMLRSLANE